MKENDLLQQYNELDPESQIQMHKKVIANEQEHLDRLTKFEKLWATPEWKELIDEWLLKDELIRIARITGTIVSADDTAIANKQAVADQILMLSLFNEKMGSIRQRAGMAAQQIAANEDAIREIQSASEEQPEEEAGE